MDQHSAVFFDLGDTLASPVVENGRLAGLSVFPLVPDVLRRLRQTAVAPSSIRIGLISNTGDATEADLLRFLTECGLTTFVDRPLCLFSSVEGLDKSQPALFRRAADRAALPPRRCWFVGEDATERAVATTAGFRVSPQPLHTLHVLAGEHAAPQPPLIPSH